MIEAQKPEWLKIRPKYDLDFSKIQNALRKRGLVTVCEEAHCPNKAECWHNQGTATFMVLGDTCTRGCQFCAVKTSSKGQKVDRFEPLKLAEAIKEMQLDYAVITAVDRDDLEDQGANHFANCVKTIKLKRPETKVELLIGDYQGNIELLKKICEAKPDVIAHNIETVKRLQGRIRDRRANYEQSMKIIEHIKKIDKSIISKSAMMVGLGETKEEIIETMKDLRKINCEIFSIGQYLKPKTKFLKVQRYITPKEFEEYKQIGYKIGFKHIDAGPFVRSSYMAHKASYKF